MMEALETTFVCCIESGSLESQTIRMLRSLRQYGGRFANAPVVAVNPRFGAPLSKNTLQIFEDLKVTYLHRPKKTNYSWFKFLNKPLALVIAEEIITTEGVCFLDSDLLIVGEPSALQLGPEEDFLGFPVECKEMGTTGPGDAYEPLWKEFGKQVGIDIEQLPWVMTAETRERVRLYFNGGVLVYRRSTGFARSYLDMTLRLLDSRVITSAKGFGEGIKEMSSIGFSAIKLGLRWRALPYSHNYNVSSATHESWYREELLGEARIIHYHDSLWPPFFRVFMDCLGKTHPQVRALDLLSGANAQRGSAAVEDLYQAARKSADPGACRVPAKLRDRLITGLPRV